MTLYPAAVPRRDERLRESPVALRAALLLGPRGKRSACLDTTALAGDG